MSSLSANAFENDTALASAALPSSLTSVGASAFRNCPALGTVSGTDGLKTIAAYAFNGCSSLQSIALPSGLTAIGQYAFADSGLTSAVVPSGVTALTQNAFSGCPDLKTVTISSGVGSLGAGSFANCGLLERVDVGEDVMTISSSAFADDSKLAEVRFRGEAPTISSDAFTGVTASAFYPIDNQYWIEDDMLDYGGSLAWSPYGDISACTLNADNLAYSGTAQAASVHLVAPNGMEVSASLYSVTYYADEGCSTPVDAANVKNPDVYYVVATGNAEKECTGTVGPATFEITKAPLTISYVSETVDSGTAPVYKVSYSGFVADDDVDDLTAQATLAAPSTLAPGHSYTLTPEGAAADNYEIEYVSGTLAVNPARIDKPACANGLVYTGKEQTGVAEGTGYVLSGTTKAVNAGEYTATIELEDGYAWADGSLDPLTYTWTIDKATLNAAFVDETINFGDNPALKVAVSGFVEGEAAGSAAGYVAPTASVTSTLKPGYSYTATVSGGKASNYTFTYTPGKVTVKPITIDAPDATLSFVYNGGEKTALTAGEGYDLSGTWKATDADTYTATATLRDGYQWTDGTTAAKRYSWTIAPTVGSLALDSGTLPLKIAESGTVTFRYTGDGTIGATSSDSSVAKATVEGDAVKVEAVGAGTARVVLASSACSNYTTPSSVTLIVNVTSIDLSACTIGATGGTYTGAPFDAQVTVRLADGTGLPAVSSHALHYYRDAACTDEVSASDVVDAGTYWVRAEAISGGRSSGRTDAASFTIGKATLTASYAGETVDYGATPAAAVTVTGFVAGESAANAKGYVAPTVALPAQLEKATSYSLAPSGGAAANYAFSYTGGKLVVRSMVVAKPAAATGLVYNGSPKTGVATGTGYTLSGIASATDAGSYTAVAKLDSGCVWSDGTTANISIPWSIAKTDIANATAAAIPAQDYTGSACEPRPSLSFGSLALSNGRDYTLGYEKNTDAGVATVVATGTGNFIGTKRMTFSIAPLALGDGCIGGLAASYAYTGESITPEPVVTCQGSTLVRDRDYSVSYANNLSSGTAMLTVAGKGNYSGTGSATFSIKKVSIEDAVITGIEDAIYSGSGIVPDAVLTLDGRQLKLGADYGAVYENNTNAGIATCTYTGYGDVTGTATATFVIKPASIATATVTGVEASYAYSGNEVRPVPTVTLGEKKLTEGTDYLVGYSDNVAVGTAGMRIIGIGNYTGEAAASFAIAKSPYDLSGVAFEGDQVVYDGKEHSLAVSGALPAGVSVSYSGNGKTAAGTYTVTATFTGDANHESVGSMSATLVIEKATVAAP